ncbi:uncharacterized protein C8R40DRAFT_1058728 [Lentinula edodes]|uniref:uncharacterized protein n=1 Tax=Lentinula edodes TaxID=5353 RepID=UPI001E8DCBFD|nr:uncharacterized protein C8R40DRAFT_1058728 [Lentinula edodes]KAH7869751.1 hypothetical protein C8R40DRAFT_1058728 [Lentinula edodes]
MSIHKSQGQTIHRVKVDLGRVFEKGNHNSSPSLSSELTLVLGQSYVALSRASSIEGLQVIGFNPKKVIAHHKVIEWNQTLQSVHENI